MGQEKTRKLSREKKNEVFHTRENLNVGKDL